MSSMREFIHFLDERFNDDENEGDPGLLPPSEQQGVINTFSSSIRTRATPMTRYRSPLSDCEGECIKYHL
jgi:hypothetical protein